MVPLSQIIRSDVFRESRIHFPGAPTPLPGVCVYNAGIFLYLYYFSLFKCIIVLYCVYLFSEYDLFSELNRVLAHFHHIDIYIYIYTYLSIDNC